MARGDPPAVPVRGVPQVSSKPLRKTRIQPATRRRASGEELDAASAGRAPPPPDRRQLCEGMLRGGFVQSFVDFFYLTHRPDPENEGRDVQVPAREAQYLRENLERAEAARRRGDTGAVYAAYANVAKYYESRAGDAATGVTTGSAPPSPRSATLARSSPPEEENHTPQTEKSPRAKPEAQLEHNLLATCGRF